MMITGIFKKVNDAVFDLVDNSLLSFEILLPFLLAWVAMNPWCVLLVITPFVAAYGITFIVAMEQIKDPKVEESRIQNMCRLCDCTHVFVEIILIVMFSMK